MQNLEGLQIFLIFHKKKSGGPWGQERPIVGADLIRTHDILSEPNRGTRGTSLRKLSWVLDYFLCDLYRVRGGHHVNFRKFHLKKRPFTASTPGAFLIWTQQGYLLKWPPRRLIFIIWPLGRSWRLSCEFGKNPRLVRSWLLLHSIVRTGEQYVLKVYKVWIVFSSKDIQWSGMDPTPWGPFPQYPQRSGVVSRCAGCELRPGVGVPTGRK